MANRSLSNRPRPRGFSYAEILLSVVLLTVLLVPALRALQSGVAGGQSPSLAARQLTLRDKMEQVLAKPFADLYAQTYPPGSNPTSVNGSLSGAGVRERVLRGRGQRERLEYPGRQVVVRWRTAVHSKG